MSGQALGHTHVWRPSPAGADRTLLLLHGTGGDENDLVPLAATLDGDANVLSPRGNVLENGMPRFFRRHDVGVLDLEDLKHRAGELADFVESASDRYGFPLEGVTAAGFSNGANVAVGLLFERPEVLEGAVLMRAMLPYEPDEAPDLEGKRVLILAGTRDPYSGRASTEGLATILRDAGARVDVNYAAAGHELTPEDVQVAKRWLEEARP